MTPSANIKLSTPDARDQAAAWFARHRAGPLLDSEATEFTAWLRADAAHTAAWTSYERIWEQLETVRDDPNVLAIREQARQRASRRHTVRCIGFVAAAAATVLLGVSAWLGKPVLVRLATLAQVTSQTPPSISLLRDASTEVGERSTILLTDGSRVTLNTASAIHADFSGPERRVTLVRGEAFFEVAKDATRPFIVSAGARDVIAVGTAFDVRLEPRQVKVTLLEGKVRVIRPAATATNDNSGKPHSSVAARTVALEPGSSLTAEEGADHIEKLDAARATSWRTGKLVFDGERLADVVAEMNRYAREKMIIAAPELAERRVSGVFESTSGPGFARALEAYGIARVSAETPTTVTLESPTR